MSKELIVWWVTVLLALVVFVAGVICIEGDDKPQVERAYVVHWAGGQCQGKLFEEHRGFRGLSREYEVRCDDGRVVQNATNVWKHPVEAK